SISSAIKFWYYHMSGISWSKLTLNELKDLCMSCGLSSVGNKEDLSNRLQAYFGKNKGKATDKSGVGDKEDLDDIIEVLRFDADEKDWNDKRDADLEVDDVHAYLQEVDNRIKDKEIEECDLLDKTWPKVSLSKPHDQHEYDFLVKIGKRLDKAIKGLGTALQIVGSNDKMMEKYKDRIPLFSQSGAASCYYSRNKSDKSYRHKKKRYSSPSSDSERDESHKGKRRYNKSFQSFRDRGAFRFPECKGVFNCFNCGGIGHITSSSLSAGRKSGVSGGKDAVSRSFELLARQNRVIT
ncbi:4184_t:CDS:2, partial [Racocetra persica]